MKSYTDLEQSKKLAEILPIESADMEYMFLKEDNSKVSNIPFIKDDDEPEWPTDSDYDFIPCWSLTALLNLCPIINGKQPILTRGKITRLWYCYYEDEIDTQTYNNPVDACVEMILKLKEQNLL